MRLITSRAFALFVAAGALLSPLTVSADIRLPDYISSNMVIQRGIAFKLHGWADPGEKITVNFNEAKRETVTGENGEFSVELKPTYDWMLYDPQTMLIEGKNKIELTNVMVGDVWMVAGGEYLSQPFKTDPPKNETETALRLFIAKGSLGNGAEGLEGRWIICDEKLEKRLPALGALMGISIADMTGHPCGLILAARSEAPIAQWIRKDALGTKTTNAGKVFESALAPLTRLPMRGVVWDHGEADLAEPDEYEARLRALIKDWREAWGNEELPFLITQLRAQAPSASAEAVSKLRLAQAAVMDHPETWMPTEFGGRNKVEVREDGGILMNRGDDMTGVTWMGPVFRNNYEIRLQARRVEGGDFFCGLTFPVKEDPCTLVLGGWGGQLCGISCLDYQDAANNETSTFREFENGKWYDVRMRVTDNQLESWVDGEKIVEVGIEGRKIGVRMEVDINQPLGVATWRTGGEVRNVTMRALDPTQTVMDRGVLNLEPKLARWIGLSVTADLGVNPAPADVIRRLQANALKNTRTLLEKPKDGPIFAMLKKEDNALSLSFYNNGEGLKFDGPAEGFEIQSADGKWSKAEASLVGQNARLKIPAGQSPKAVRYGWGLAPSLTLVNSADLPTVPFVAEVK